MSQSLGRDVIVVGAGIQGIWAALTLRERGFAVRVHAAGVDPRRTGDTRSSTHSGEAIRLITLLEGCPYVGHPVDSPDIAGVFERTVTQGGWLGRPLSDGDADAGWLRERQAAWADRERVGRTLKRSIETARRAMTLWPTLHDSRPGLFAGVDWHDRGVLRLYDDPATAARAAEVYRDLAHGEPSRTNLCHPDLGAADVRRAFPWLADAVDGGAVAGALRIDGYALDVKRFVRNAIDDLERRQVEFRWQSDCERPEFDAGGRVSGLRFAHGTERADHYVLAPGAYAGAGLLESLGVRVSGLAGRWLLLPRPAGFSMPTKAHFGPRVTGNGQRRAVLDLNIMTCRDAVRGADLIAVGGGYLHVGGWPFRFDAAELAAVDAEIERAARRLMPAHFADAEANGTVVRPGSTCVRSITADDRPAVVVRPTASGGHLILHTGLNTGTTTLAPAVAEDVADVLTGTRGPSTTFPSDLHGGVTSVTL